MDGAGDRRSRTLLVASHLVVVLATLPLLPSLPATDTFGFVSWVLGMVALSAASMSARLDRWFRRWGRVALVAMILWLVMFTGGASSPYGILYLPLLGFVAVFRSTRTFATTMLIVFVASLVPYVVAFDARAVAMQVLVAAAAVATLWVLHRAATDYRDANRLYLTVLEHHAGPTYTIGRDGTMIWANEPLQQILGLPLGEIAGLPWPDLVADGETDRLMPQFLAALDGAPQQVTAETDAPGGRFQLRGTIFPMYRNGRVVGVMGITEDVTELHAAAFGAEALRQTLDALEFPVAVFAADSRETLYANDAAGRLAADGSPCDGRLGWEQLPPELRRGPPTAESSRTTTITIDRQGDRAEWDVTVQALDGEPEVLVLTAVDATERVRREKALSDLADAERDAAERLRTLDQMKNAFLTAVSHELRTPLTVILGGAKSLQRLRGDGEETPRSRLEDAMVRQAEELTSLLSDLLDVDRLTRGATRSSVSTFDVVDLVRRQVEARAGSQRVDIQAPSALGVFADPVQIGRIVANLLDNAFKYAPGSPATVTIDELPDGGFRLEVADAGPGIPPEERERIFEPFYRLDDDHPQPGTGIGLALVAEFASTHGGRAWAADRPGGGTRIVVEIPERRRSTPSVKTDPDAAAPDT